MADRSVVVRLKADVAGFKASMSSARKSVDDLTKADVNKPAKAFDSMATKAAFMGGAIALGIGKAIASFAEFDSTMSAAAAATGSTGEQLAALRDAAIKAGADTQFSATEAAQGITEMAKAGVSAKDILGGGLTGALDLAAAGQLDVGSAAEIAATALNQFNLEGTDVAHVADLYSAAAGKAQGSVNDVAGAMKYAGVTAASMGVSIEETTGVIGLFASKGIIGEQAGTSFRSMLMSLTAPSKIAAKEMENLGINVYDAQGQFVGMEGAAQILQEKLGPLDEATRNAALGQIFGNEAMGAAITLYQAGGKGVADWTEKVNDAGFAQEQAAKLTDNLKGDIERLGGSLETAFITTGSGANGALRTLTQGLGDLVNKVGKVPGPILLAGAAVTSLALLGPKALSSFRQWRSDLDSMGLSMDKLSAKAPRTASAIGLVGKAAGALALASAAVYAFGDAADSLNADKLGADLVTASDGLALVNKELAASTDNGWGRVGSDIDSFGKILGATFDPGIVNNIDDTIGSLKTVFGGENVSNIANATKQLGAIDQALAGLVTSGHADQASATFAEMSRVAQEQGISVEQLQQKLPGYTTAVANAGTAAATAAPQMDGMSQDVKNLEQAADDAKTAMDELEQTILGFGSPLAEQRAAQRDFQAAIDGAAASLKAQKDELIQNRLQMLGITAPTKAQTAEAGKWATAQVKASGALNNTTDAGRANETALDNIRAATLKNVTSTFKLTGSADQATAAMKSGRTAFVNAAVAAGKSAKEANTLADKLGLIPENVKTQIALSGVPTAKTQADAVQGKVDKLGRTKAKPTVAVAVNGATAAAAEARLNTIARNRSSTITTTVVTRNVTTGVGVSGATKAVNRAGGGPVYGPGSAVSDSIDAKLSNGEYVVKTAAVDKYGLHFMHELNAMRLAEGGHVTRSPGDYARQMTAAPPGLSLVGMRIEGTLDTPFGPAQMRGIVRRELSAQVREAAYGARD